MLRKFMFAASVILLSGVTAYISAQKAKPIVSANADIAWFRIDGSRLSSTAGKRLTFVTLHYNDVAVPCIVTDTSAGPLSNDTVGGSSISCGWSPEAIGALSSAGK